jgi:hypothetical protein
MHAEKLLHKIIGKSCQIDKRIINTLFEAAATLTHCKKLSIFGIARALPRAAKVKHLIKCIDRLFGNKTLHNKRYQFYQAIINLLVKGNFKPIIVIDWSGLTCCGEYHFLRAAMTVKGRTLTLYEQSYHISEYGNYKTHKNFLHILHSLLPKDCHPIIVTDAGFRNNWFRLVQALGWDFVGRIRHNTQGKKIDDLAWEPIKNLYAKATHRAKFLGRFLLAKSGSLSCYFYLFKRKKLYREKRNLAGKKIKCSVSLKHARGENEPWLIATSINPETISAEKVMIIYKKRMQIEESFRDLKNARNGFSLRQCRSLGRLRLDIALLIGTLAMLVLWLIGMVAKRKDMQYGFQSNTIRSRNVLSVISIGWQVLERHITFNWIAINQALQELVLCASN